MARVLLLLPTATYKAADFVDAATRMGVDIVVGSEHRQALAGLMGDRALVVPLVNPSAAVEAIVALNSRSPLDAVVAVDDQGILVAAAASERLGLAHHPPAAVAATRDKANMRSLFSDAGLPQPAHRLIHGDDDVLAACESVGYPCVVKPVSRSASQGVIRVDDPAQATAAVRRIRAILGTPDGEAPTEPLLVESFIPGREVAVEGLVTAGGLTVLAVFDKPDPLDGPFFEETIYVTPSREPESVLARVEQLTADAAAALGLRDGPVHAEMRIGPDGTVTLLELAARSIGGLCGRALRFGSGVSLEEMILRHGLDMGIHGLTREAGASGVMMLPIAQGGLLDSVTGQDEALATPGIEGLEITIGPGKPVVPLPEGDRYLGFMFARGTTAAQVEAALREGHARLQVNLR